MANCVHIEFDCLPLRSIHRWDAPLDASAAYRDLLERLKAAARKHGLHNTYFLHHAHCTYRLTNDPAVGMLEFRFQGTVLTDSTDQRSRGSELHVELARETCPWLTQPVVRWFTETVKVAVEREFDRYIAAGDLQRTRERIEKIQAESDAQDGFLGMFL